MILRFGQRFRQQVDALPHARQVEVLWACLQIPAAFASPKQHAGLGLRKVNPKGYWEIRVGLDLRVVFRLQKSEATLVMVGNHDEVRRYLRNV